MEETTEPRRRLVLSSGAQLGIIAATVDLMTPKSYYDYSAPIKRQTRHTAEDMRNRRKNKAARKARRLQRKTR